MTIQLLVIYLSVLLLGLVLYTSMKCAGKKALYLKYVSFATVSLLSTLLLESAQPAVIVLYATVSVFALWEVLSQATKLRRWLLYVTGTLALLCAFCYTAAVPHYPHARLFVCVLSFDAFSQFFGQLIGRHALWPAVSPNKTIEGSLGGLAVCLLSSQFLFGAVWPGFLIAASALAGDLLASFVKRRCGIKDFSKLLPGQGGVLDRFDSFIVSSVFYLIIL